MNDSARLDAYNVIWHSPGSDSGASMPVGGGDIGLNVWVEEGDVLFYIARSGTFDENNQLLKLGRVRLSLEPGPFLDCATFRQQLYLRQGYVEVEGFHERAGRVSIRIWVETGRPSCPHAR